MNKSIRNILLPLIAILAMVCIILSTSLLVNSSKAYAEGTVAEQAFYVQDGASVRTKPDDQGRTGIRFTTVISEEFYSQHENDTWGVIWGKNVAEGTELTYEKAKEDTSGEVIKYKEGINPTLSGDNYVIRLVIHFKDVDEAKKIAAYNTKLTVRAYVKESKESEESGESEDKITYAYTNDNTRSVKEVAEKVLLDDALSNEPKYDSQPELRNVLEEYATAYVETKTTEAYIVKGAEGTYSITNADSEFADKALYFNNNEISALSGLTTTEVGDLTLGEYYSLAYVNDNGCIVQQPVQYVTEVVTGDRLTKIITETYYYTGGKVYNYNTNNTGASDYTADGSEDVAITLPDELPYYVLGENVTYTKPHKEYGGNCQPIFHGILDGKGYTVDFKNSNDGNNNRTLSGGVFNYLSEGSQIKNVEFTVYQYAVNNGASGVIAKEFLGDNVIENVVITVEKISWLGTEGSRPHNLLAGSLNNLSMNNVLINLCSFNGGSSTDYVFALGFDLTDASNIKNVTVIYPTSFADNTIGQVVVASSASRSDFKTTGTLYYANNTGITAGAPTAEGLTTQTLSGVNVYFSDDLTGVPAKVGSWTIDTNQKVASEDFVQSQYKTIATVKDTFYLERIDKVQLNEEAYLQADGTFVGIEEELTTVTIDGVDYMLSDGKVASFSGVLGEVYCMEYTVGSTIYTSPVQYVTEVISTDDRLSAILGTNESSEGDLPYYVLRNENGGNFTYTKPVQHFGDSIIFHGILNGKGNTVDFVNGKDSNNRTLSGGLFNKLSQGSQIKNVEFIVPNYAVNNGTSGVIAKEFLGDNVIENVVITVNKISWLGTVGGRALHLLAASLENLSMNNVLINLYSFNGDSNTDYVFALGCDLTDVSNIKNVTVIYPSNFSTKTIGQVVVASSASRSDFKTTGTLYYANNTGITDGAPTADGLTTQTLSGVNVYFSDNLAGVPAKVGSWTVDTSKLGADAMATYVDEGFKAEDLATGDRIVDKGDTFQIETLVSSKGVYRGIIRFNITDKSIVTYDKETNTFTAEGVGETTVKYSYIVDGQVYTKEFTVTVEAVTE